MVIMDVTGGMSASIDKITAALPGMEASIAADVSQAVSEIQAGITQLEAAEVNVITQATTALTNVLAPFAALVPHITAILDGKKRVIITLEDV